MDLIDANMRLGLEARIHDNRAERLRALQAALDVATAVEDTTGCRPVEIYEHVENGDVEAAELYAKAYRVSALIRLGYDPVAAAEEAAA